MKAAPAGEVYVCCRGHMMDEVRIESRRVRGDDRWEWEDEEVCAGTIGDDRDGGQIPCEERWPPLLNRTRSALYRAMAVLELRRKVAAELARREATR